MKKRPLILKRMACKATALLFSFMIVCAIATAAFGQYTYTYSGSPYTQTYGVFLPDPPDGISGYFSTSSPLVEGWNDMSATTFLFDIGAPLDSSSSLLFQSGASDLNVYDFDIHITATGTIDDWLISMSHTAEPYVLSKVYLITSGHSTTIVPPHNVTPPIYDASSYEAWSDHDGTPGLDYAYTAWNTTVGSWSFTPPSSVPEPATMLLLGIGLMGLAGVRRFKN